jgi:hypothetical protein
MRLSQNPSDNRDRGTSLGLSLFYRLHPNPLPEGEGAILSHLTIPSSTGRGTQGEGIRGTLLACFGNSETASDACPTNP